MMSDPADDTDLKQARLTAEDRLPGDLTREALIDRMIRVDHAGEYGAVRIYRGQRAVIKSGPAAEAIDEMAEAEHRHLAAFDDMIGERRVRPTALMPVWHVAGYALGAVTAAMGDKAAMACTQAIEEVIDEHYAAQARALGDDEAALRETIEKFRAEEIEHRDTAIAHDAEEAPGYEPLTAVVKAGSRVAIWLSERV